MNKRYVGMGTSTTPTEMHRWLKNAAVWLDSLDYMLCSGHTEKADIVFEDFSMHKEIYLPWKGFNESTSELSLESMPNVSKATEIARKFNPNFGALSDREQKQIIMSGFQVLGQSLEEPVDFVLCWTEGGKIEGNIGQVLRIARYYEIPIFDFGSYSSTEAAIAAFPVFLTERRTKRNRECSSRGDRRFSAMFANVVNKKTGQMTTIEKLYQAAKRNAEGLPAGKGQYPAYMEIDGEKYSNEAMVPYYYSLWVDYFTDNPNYVIVVRNYDTFTDMFRGKSKACQADAVKIVRDKGIAGLREVSDYSKYKEI